MLRQIITLAALINFSSCISSLHQLVTYDKVATDPRMAGRWQEKDNTLFTIEDLLTSKFYKNNMKTDVNGKEKNTGFDSREDSLLYSKSYILGFNKSGYDYTMIVSLMQLNNDLYADLIAVSATGSAAGSRDNLFDATDYRMAHTLAKIKLGPSSLEIKFLDSDYLKNQLLRGTMAIKYEDDRLFNTTLITASSADLQQFLLKYGKDERLYNSRNTITLRKI